MVEFGKRLAFGVRDVEDVGDAESAQLISETLSPFRILSASSAVFLRTHGARIAIPFAPFFTLRPKDFHV